MVTHKSEADGRLRFDSADIVWAAICVGLIAGLLEGTVFTVVRLVPGWITWSLRERNVSWDVLWIAPLVNAALFGIIGILLAAGISLLRMVPRGRTIPTPRVAIMTLVWLACYVVLRTPDRLYRYAAVLLALGVAARAISWLWKRETAPKWRRLATGVLMGVGALALVVRSSTAVFEATEARSLPAAASGAPDVLLIVMDTVRADHLSAYGYRNPTTPNLDRFAAEGVLFTRAIAPSSWTLPSHASIFTGRPVSEHRADYTNPALDRRYPTLAELMRAKGYLTAGFSANTLWANRGVGLARGFIHFDDYFSSLSDAVARTVLGQEVVSRLLRILGHRDELGRRSGGNVTASFLEWIQGAPARPFFAFLNYYEAHGPYTAPERYRAQVMTPADFAIDEVFRFPIPPRVFTGWEAGRSYWTAAYDAGLSDLDDQIGNLIGALRSSGRLDKTLVVITSDHGEALSDHGRYGHGNGLTMDQVWVPLMVRMPGVVPEGLEVTDPVSTADILATVLQLSGSSSGANLPGESLSRFWSDGRDSSRPRSSAVFSEVGFNALAPPEWPTSLGTVRSVVTHDGQFIEYADGSTELFAFANDPVGESDLAATPDSQATVAEFQRWLSRLSSEIGRGR